MSRQLGKNTIKKYQRIVDEWFINGFNGAQAYKKYNKTVKKDDTASVNFNKIKLLPEVNNYIIEKHEQAAKIVETTHEGILQELKNWIQLDITETICLSAEEIKLLPIEIRRLITRFKRSIRSHYDKEGNLLETVENIELHFVSKERAIEMINKHVGFYEKDNEQKSNDIHIHTGKESHRILVQNLLSGK